MVSILGMDTTCLGFGRGGGSDLFDLLLVQLVRLRSDFLGWIFWFYPLNKDYGINSRIHCGFEFEFSNPMYNRTHTLDTTYLAFGWRGGFH